MMRLCMLLLVFHLHVTSSQEDGQLFVGNAGSNQDEFNNMEPSHVEIPINVMDPATFTPNIRTCQKGCGDTYFKCAFDLCGQTNSNFDREFVRKDESYDMRPSFTGRLLSILTFGYMGNQQDYTLTGDESTTLKEDSDETCFFNCVDEFRTCYHTCVCQFNIQADECRPTKIPLIPFLSNTDTEYTFNWNNFKN